jgi:S-adenosylmethionine synthetase
MRSFVLTSESVTVGHPDKLCDQISDAVIDAYLDSGIRTPVNVECAMATGVVFLSVRAAAEAPFDPAALARRVIEEAGYAPQAASGPSTVMLDLVPEGEVPAAGGAGSVSGTAMAATNMTTAFGHACRHTPEDMAFPIWAAHRLTRALDAARREGRIGWLRPDAQAQVAVAFRDRQPVRVQAVAITTASPDLPGDEAVAADLVAEVIAPAFAGSPIAPDAATRMVLLGLRKEGGPLAHSGLTGRKLSDDSYGGFVRQSATALSGKAPARTDRLASYAARHAARAVVAAGLAAECEVQLSYVIGDAGPVTVEVDTFGSGALSDERISARLKEMVDFRVGAIVERFSLWDLPGLRGGRFYRDLATYGHMGRDDLAPPWEDTTIAADLV